MLFRSQQIIHARFQYLGYLDEHFNIWLSRICNPFGDYGRIFIQLFRKPFIAFIFLCEP